MRVTRGQLVAGAAASALGAAGIYELVDRLAGGAPSRPAAGDPGVEQHLLPLETVDEDGVEVLVPPLHHQVVTARLLVPPRPRELREAQRALEASLARLDREFEPTPAGLGVTVAWGLPYFRRYLPALAALHLPVDRRASASKEKPVRALQDAIRFPSDPQETVLEANDLAVLLRSDSSEHVAAGARLFRELAGLLEPTSIRKGFVGGGLPRRLAVAAGVPGADLIPAGSQLFLGFTSTQKDGLGPARIANLETLGYTDAGEGYFRGGTHMHLSHIFEDLEAWYLNFDFRERVDTVFRPDLDVAAGTRTVRQAPEDVEEPGHVRDVFKRSGRFGHSGAIQSTSRLPADVVADDGTVHRRGTAVPQRADFNTLDNPFFWSADPGADGMGEGPAAGVHFVVFNPTSDDFHRNRLAMDGVLPDGTRLALPPRARGQGFNAILRTTHRQNFLVPPRAHRSLPLVELL